MGNEFISEKTKIVAHPARLNSHCIEGTLSLQVPSRGRFLRTTENLSNDEEAPDAYPNQNLILRNT
jgi:hypothetical protein